MDAGLYFDEYTENWWYESEGLEITDAMISTFVDLCRFTSPTFTDRKYVEANYSGRMAPGIFVLSLAEGLVLNAGLTRKRGIFLMELHPKFLKPAFAGDVIVNRVKLHSRSETSKPDRGVVVTSHEVANQKGEVVISYLSTRMIRTRAFVEAG
jgi:acyl dehydratase